MKSAQYEQALKQLGVEFDYEPAVPISEISRKRGLQNQARVGNALLPERIEQYRELYEEGFVAPPLVLWRPGKSGLYTPNDGNQRLAAIDKMKKPLTHHDAYILHTDDEKLANFVSWTINQLVNGEPLTQDECMAHALTYVRMYGETVKVAAKRAGVKESELHRKVQEAHVRDVLRSAGLKRQDMLPTKTILDLTPIEKAGKDVLVSAARAIIDNGLTGVQTDRLLDKIKLADSTKKLKVIEEFCEEPETAEQKATTGAGRYVRRTATPADQLHAQIDDMTKLFTKYPDNKAFRVKGHKHETYADLVSQLMDRLAMIYGGKRA